LTACFHAFEGGFAGGVPFTLYAPLANKLVLYVYEENCYYLGSPRRIFNDKCRKIVAGLSEVAGMLIEMEEQGCITLEYSGRSRSELPADHAKNWRKYENFYPSESEALLYVMSVKITSIEKLYQLNRRPRLVIHRNR
jgi:hypothetical protein